MKHNAHANCVKTGKTGFVMYKNRKWRCLNISLFPGLRSEMTHNRDVWYYYAVIMPVIRAEGEV